MVSMLKSTTVTATDTLTNPEFTIFVGDITPEVDDTALYLCFALRYQSCTGAKVIRDGAGYSKGFGFVKFTDEKEKDKAMVEMAGFYGLGSKYLKTNPAIQQKRAYQDFPLFRTIFRSGYIPDLRFLLYQYQQHQGELELTNPVAAAAAKAALAKPSSNPQAAAYYNHPSVVGYWPGVLPGPKNARPPEQPVDEMTKFYQSVTTTKKGTSKTGLPLVVSSSASLASATGLNNAQPLVASSMPDPLTNSAYQMIQYQQFWKQQCDAMQLQNTNKQNILYNIPPLKDDPNDLVSYDQATAPVDIHMAGMTNPMPGQTLPLATTLIVEKMNEEFIMSQNGEVFGALEKSRWHPFDFDSHSFVTLEF